MKRRFEVIATVGKFTDPDTGKPAKRTVAVGAIFESSGGKLVLRIDAVPVAPDWSGWMQLRPLTPENRQRGKSAEIELTPEQSEIIAEIGPQPHLAVIPSQPDAAPGVITIRATQP